MTVRELLDALKDADPDMPIVIDAGGGWHIIDTVDTDWYFHGSGNHGVLVYTK
jgi:hypothetical protein